MSASYYDDPSGCKNDRKAFTRFDELMTVFNDYIELVDGATFYRHWRRINVHIEIYGSKRNSLCTWNTLYQTLYDLRNSSFTVNVFKNVSHDYYSQPPLAPSITKSYSILEPISVVLPDFSTPYETVKFIVYDQLIGDWVVNEAISTTAPVRVHIEGKTRGTDGWAIIDCQ